MKKPNIIIQDAYRLESKDVLAFYKTTLDGLNDAESVSRISRYGSNNLKNLKKSPIIFKFFSQFKDLMIILLIVSAAIALYLGDIRTFSILIAIVIINALIGFIQEYKADRVTESLMSLMVPEAKVYRSGQLEVVEASKLVPGD
ncbi:hypothetical protein CO052_02905, partial [Candidatus Saccharibacteria bacterium CG_4_9_14_0_2_um_filter_41_9]